MSYLKTMDAIFKNMPALNEEDEKQINLIHTPYLFYEEHPKRQVRECWCSVCGKHFYYDYVQRTETQEHYQFLNTRHNSIGKCPECKNEVNIKNTGKAKDCKNLEEWKRFCIIKTKSKNEVYVICGYSNKNYFCYPYTHFPDYGISTVYYLVPGSVKEFKKNYYSGEWSESKSITEPFMKTYCYNWSCIEKRGYTIIGYKEFAKSFLKYAPCQMFQEEYERYVNSSHYYIYEIPMIKFLCYSAVYPSVEKLLKIGLSDFVCRLVDGFPQKRYINWNADVPNKMFSMNKAQFRDFREHYYGTIDFQVYQLLKRVKPDISYSDVVGFVKKFAGESSVRVAQKIKDFNLNITHTFNYLLKHTKTKSGKIKSSLDYENTAILWTDYLTFAKELKYDLKRDDVIFPKRLREAHDNASSAVVALHNKKQFEQYKSRYEKLKKLYEYSNSEYQIVIPMGVNDIVEEGKALHHCVGGYAERHLIGKTTILFMRKCDATNQRFITIEFNEKDKRISQSHGDKNRNLTKQEKAFVDEWLIWVKAGSKRPKKKKTASAA